MLERVVAAAGDGTTAGDDAAAAARAAARVTDAHMWVCFGGRERTVEQFEGLLRDGGFSVRRVTPLEGAKLVAIEAEPLVF